MESESEKPKGVEQAPEVLKKTLIGRSVFSYEVAIMGQHADALLDDAYIKGLCTEQERLSKSVNLLFWTSLFLSWVLLSENIELDQVPIPVAGITLPAGVITKLVLLFSLAAVFAQAITKFLSVFLIGQFLEKAGQHHFGDAWRVYIAKFRGTDVWTDVLVPRVYGYSSTKSHWLLVLLSLLVSVAYLLFAVVFVNFAAISAFSELWSAARNWIEILIAISALTMILGPTMLTFFAIIVPFKFRFKKET